MTKFMVIVALIFYALSFLSLGYIMGFYAGLSFCYDKALFLLEKQGLSIQFDEGMLKTAFFRYYSHMGEFIDNEVLNETGGKNALIYNDSRD